MKPFLEGVIRRFAFPILLLLISLTLATNALSNDLIAARVISVTDGDNLLEIGETWTYGCSAFLTTTTTNIADVTVTQLLFDNGVRSHIFVSWLHPFKEQKLVVVGTEKMAVFDDVSVGPYFSKQARPE